MARYLLAGCDVWLNNPRRPLEASGTSGMKAALNGALNLSTLDGWWDEGYDPECGWAIGHGEEYRDTKLQDEVESKALFDLLEREIVPLFYTRGRDGLPRDWIRRMKASMIWVGHRFTSHRMLMEYAQSFYLPALKRAREFIDDGCQRCRELSAYIQKLRGAWGQLRVDGVSTPQASVYTVGDRITATARVHLGALKPEEVRVELYYGPVSSTGEIEDARTLEMSPAGAEKGSLEYRVELECDLTGRQGYTVRVLPKHPSLAHNFLPGLVRWA
jgi:starch phosphorylase